MTELSWFHHCAVIQVVHHEGDVKLTQEKAGQKAAPDRRPSERLRARWKRRAGHAAASLWID